MWLPEFLREKRVKQRKEEERREFDVSDTLHLTDSGKAYLAVDFVERSARELDIIPDFRGVKPNECGYVSLRYDSKGRSHPFNPESMLDLDIERWVRRCRYVECGKLPVLVFVDERDAIAVYTGEKKLALTEKCCDKRAEDAEEGC